MPHLKAVVGASQCNCIWTVLSNLPWFVWFTGMFCCGLHYLAVW